MALGDSLEIPLPAIAGLKNRLSGLDAEGDVAYRGFQCCIQVPAQTISRIELIKHKLKHLYLSTDQRGILPVSRGLIVDGTVVLINYTYDICRKRIPRELSHP